MPLESDVASFKKNGTRQRPDRYLSNPPAAAMSGLSAMVLGAVRGAPEGGQIVTIAGDDTKLPALTRRRPTELAAAQETPTPPPIKLKGFQASALHIACTILRDGIEIRQALRSI